MIELTTRQQSELRKIGIAFCYLFGSHARGNPGPASDYDVAIYLSPKVRKSLHFNRHLDTVGFFNSFFKSDNVDVVVLNIAPNLLAMSVITEGKLLLDDDRPLRIDFETSTTMRYLDYLPYAKRHIQALIKRYA